MEQTTYLNEYTVYMCYSFWMPSHPPVLQYLQSAELSCWRAVVRSDRCRWPIASLWLVFWIFTSWKHWPWHIKIRILPLSPSLFTVFSLEGPGAGCHRARPTSQRLGHHGNREKGRCSTWWGCTQPPLWSFWGEGKKPIHCETVTCRNIFLPLKAIKEGTGVLIYTVVTVTRTLKDSVDGQTQSLLHVTSKLLPSWWTQGKPQDCGSETCGNTRVL